MSKNFWFWVRILGWSILLLWYIIYAYNAIEPIFSNPFFSVLHGIIGVVATLLIMIGYYDLEKNIRKNKH
jgi:nicotinamide riboside transporter PnuC